MTTFDEPDTMLNKNAPFGETDGTQRVARIFSHCLEGMPRKFLRGIECSCDGGLFGIRLAEMNPFTRLFCVDATTSDHRRACEAADERHVRNIDFMRAELTSLPFADGYFDFAVSVAALHRWERPVAALRELMRVVRPGGVLVISDLRGDGADGFFEKSGDPALFAAYTEEEVASIIFPRAGITSFESLQGFPLDHDARQMLGMGSLFMHWKISRHA